MGSFSDFYGFFFGFPWVPYWAPMGCASGSYKFLGFFVGSFAFLRGLMGSYGSYGQPDTSTRSPTLRGNKRFLCVPFRVPFRAPFQVPFQIHVGIPFWVPFRVLLGFLFRFLQVPFRFFFSFACDLDPIPFQLCVRSFSCFFSGSHALLFVFLSEFRLGFLRVSFRVPFQFWMRSSLGSLSGSFCDPFQVPMGYLGLLRILMGSSSG